MNTSLTKHQLDLLGKWTKAYDELYIKAKNERIRAKKREERNKKMKEIFE